MAPPRWKKTRSRQKNIKKDTRSEEIKAAVAEKRALLGESSKDDWYGGAHNAGGESAKPLKDATHEDGSDEEQAVKGSGINAPEVVARPKNRTKKARREAALAAQAEEEAAAAASARKLKRKAEAADAAAEPEAKAEVAANSTSSDPAAKRKKKSHVVR